MKNVTAAKQQVYVNIPHLKEIDYHFKGKNTTSGWGWQRDTRKALVTYPGRGQFVELILVDDNGVKIDGARKKFTMNPDGAITLKDSDGVEVQIGKWAYSEEEAKVFESTSITAAKNKTLASAPTKEELENLINRFYYSKNYVITDDNKVYNTKNDKFLDDVGVTQKRGRWVFYSIDASTNICCSDDTWNQVIVYVINEGTPSQYYGLKSAEDGHILYAAPNNWKSRKGAERWAEKHGFTVVESSNDIFSDTDIDFDEDSEDYYESLATGVVREFNSYFSNLYNIEYEISDAAITFIVDGRVSYIQPTADIIPNWSDLDRDIDELSEAVIGEEIPQF